MEFINMTIRQDYIDKFKILLKIKGKKVNLDQQDVDFYWFRKNVSITSANKTKYNVVAGEGW